jgi:hypothetical protein
LVAGETFQTLKRKLDQSNNLVEDKDMEKDDFAKELDRMEEIDLSGQAASIPGNLVPKGFKLNLGNNHFAIMEEKVVKSTAERESFSYPAMTLMRRLSNKRYYTFSFNLAYLTVFIEGEDFFINL